jgi:hypothetical protein
MLWAGGGDRVERSAQGVADERYPTDVVGGTGHVVADGVTGRSEVVDRSAQLGDAVGHRPAEPEGEGDPTDHEHVGDDLGGASGGDVGVQLRHEELLESRPVPTVQTSGDHLRQGSSSPFPWKGEAPRSRGPGHGLRNDGDVVGVVAHT